MFSRFFLLFVASVSVLLGFAGVSYGLGFTYQGFRPGNLDLDGTAELTKNGILMVTNGTQEDSGHAFHPHPIDFKSSSNGQAFSFSTTFVFAIRSTFSAVSAEGLAFFIAPTKVLPGGRQMGSLGLYDGNASSGVCGVELDTFQNPNTPDLDNNHVAIDIRNIDSVVQTSAGYFPDGPGNGSFQNLTLMSGKPIQIWVDYDGHKKEINVTLAPFEARAKPRIPLLHLKYDLSHVLQQSMYVGFSGATGPFVVRNYVLGWSFSVNGGAANQLDLSRLPKLPKLGADEKKISQFYTVGLPLICFLFISMAVIALFYYIRTRRKYAELVEDWEVDYGPHRFKYKDLYFATKGFRETELLGAGGFGRVYRGVLESSGDQIAVKRISHESRQGIREFVAEVVSIGRMSHRNLVPLLGYCRRKAELILVYQYMPNGSLDRLLYGLPKFTLTWAHRFQIIKGVASGLFYLHEGWEKIVIHRDVKSSNVLLDGEFNGRLGDFGLARLHEHGTNPQTTKIVGTVGYLAPEYCRSGRATTATDVYAFGIFLFEVVSGKRPIEQPAPEEDILLVEWVLTCWEEGRILEAVDQRLGNDHNIIRDEAELALKIGLLCAHPEPSARPSMQNVVLYLNGSMPLPELSSLSGISTNSLTFAYGRGFEDVSVGKFSSSSTGRASTPLSFVADSLLSGGR